MKKVINFCFALAILSFFSLWIISLSKNAGDYDKEQVPSYIVYWLLGTVILAVPKFIYWLMKMQED